MNVASLQEHFLNLSSFIDQMGAHQKTVNDLRKISKQLELFKSYSFDSFIAFLSHSEQIRSEYERTGKIPYLSPKTTARKNASSTPLFDSNLLAEIGGIIQTHYESAPHANFSYQKATSEIKAAAEREDVTIPLLKEAAKYADAGGGAKSKRSKNTIVTVIMEAIKRRKDSSDRKTL